jgi:hypothetical protein
MPIACNVATRGLGACSYVHGPIRHILNAQVAAELMMDQFQAEPFMEAKVVAEWVIFKHG